MIEAIRSLVLRLLRVPPEPAVPQGARVIRVFRAAPNYYRYRLIVWALAQISALFGLIGGLVFISSILRTTTQPALVLLLQAVEVLAWAGYLAQLPLSLAALRLDFDMRWYILMDRSLRIREGIFSIQEKTMTFANIQQISIRRNPLQRLLGLADVQVRTAGGGSGSGGSHGGGGHVGEGMHEAFFRGVDNPEEIRTAIRERVRLHRDAGLGDPDEAPALAAGHVTRAATAGDLTRRDLAGDLTRADPAGLPPAALGAPAGAATTAGGAENILAAARELRDEARRWREARPAL